MRRSKESPLFLALMVVAATAVLVARPAPSRAGGDEKAKPDKKPHLVFRRTYEQALAEARVRNVPVLVSRHKDF